MNPHDAIAARLAQHARTTPTHPALVHEGRTWTYAELDRRVDRLVCTLAERGVGPGDRVAFLGHNHPAALEVLFACARLGAVDVPIHPGFDAPTLDRLFEDATPVFTVVTAPRRAQLDASTRARIVPRLVVGGPSTGEDYEAALADAPRSRPPADVALHDLALLAFSSGTTGRNKGVMLSHGNLAANAINVVDGFDVRAADVLLASAPLFRMGGLGFCLAVLFAGGTCVVTDRPDAASSLALIERHRITTMFDGVAAMEALAAAPGFAAADLSSLRSCVTGGTLVPASVVESFERRGLCLQPGYGLTEAAPVALFVPRHEVARHRGAAGRPPRLSQARIVGDDGQPVAPGEVGELWVRGPNVMLGYFGDPVATSRALVGNGWLRTGDAAWQTADGMVYVVGRVDDAIRIGGRTFHPAPFEADLGRLPGVAECAFVPSNDPSAPDLAVVVDDARAFSGARMRAQCRAELGVVPRLVHLAALPRNPNGKILRTALRESIAAAGAAKESGGARRGSQPIARPRIDDATAPPRLRPAPDRPAR